MTIEKLTELQDKGYTIASRRPIELATELKAEYVKRVDKITIDRDLSPHGKLKAKEAVEKELAREALRSAADIKAEYLATANAARKLASELLAKPHVKPKDATQVALFERDLDDLKTAVMLGVNAKRSIEAIEGFVRKHGDEPYYADQIKNQFSTLAGAVLGIESSPQNRQALSQVLDRVNEKVTTPEREKAAEILSFYESAENRRLFLDGSAAQKSIASIVGTVGNRLNDADRVIAEMEEVEQVE